MRLRSFFSSEGRLLRQASRGEPRALERLYEENVDALYAFAYYRTGRDGPLSEDVVQETFTRALDSMDRFDPKRGSLRAWLITLSRNVIRDQLRARDRTATVEQWERLDRVMAQVLTSLDQQILSDEVIERAETRDLVNMTITNLPEQYRSVLERKYIEGASLDELARWLGVSQEAAKSRLARARRAFRETFCALTQSMAEVNE